MAVQEDEVLIAEIAPAMVSKLQRDGRAKGSLIASAAVVVAIALSQQLAELSRLSHYVYLPIFGHAALLAATVALVVLPSFLKRKNLSDELSFRRKHGKWRWEH